MAGIEIFLDGIGTLETVSRYTGRPNEAAKASAYALWVRYITGDIPKIESLPNNRARFVLSENQKRLMTAFLDEQIENSLKGLNNPNPPIVEYGIGDVVKPWTGKYVIPIAILIFLVGVISGRVIKL